MSVNRPLTGYRLVSLLHGDTLQEVAARELGDASKWADIVAINNLRPPYLTADPDQASDGVKLFGDMILVPATTTIATVNADTDAAAVFGVDLDLTGGDLHVDGGDLRLISGRANLKQALIHRVKTHLKELLFHLPYGCGVHRLIGAVNGPTAALLGGQYVRGAMLADPRVDTVLAVRSAAEGDVVPIAVEIQPIAGAPIEVPL